MKVKHPFTELDFETGYFRGLNSCKAIVMCYWLYMYAIHSKASSTIQCY